MSQKKLIIGVDGVVIVGAVAVLQMHGEMMRAMGDIMIKYADKLEVLSSPQ
ncbi:hypothetical protein [Pollutimonas nitritireducens]|uniref:hypothetical protein n=1 Tax=Pollutimonas nitritireducens TaxID=2045209 RepID=UPI001304133A|nr:hypothetical protein [Pollutimonas nitritireducens]